MATKKPVFMRLPEFRNHLSTYNLRGEIYAHSIRSFPAPILLPRISGIAMQSLIRGRAHAWSSHTIRLYLYNS